MPNFSRKKAKPVRVKRPIVVEDKKARKKKGLSPGRTLESVESQMVSLATDVARKQMEDGTASAQVITHYLKLGTTLARLETEKLVRENELLKAKTEAIKSQANVDILYKEALQAMRAYSGNTNLHDQEGPIDDEDS